MKLILTMIFLGFFNQSVLGADIMERKTDGEFVTISGKVTTVAPDFFKVKMRDETILVEMDDYDWDADGYKLALGDRVVVTGVVDHDFLEKKKIEAGSVYVKNINSYFYANSDDEEDYPYVSTTYFMMSELPDNASVDLKGRVVEVDGREFVLDTGFRKVTIDTSDLIYNPMDDKGYTQVDLGDRLRVTGLVDDQFFDGKEIMANFISEV